MSFSVHKSEKVTVTIPYELKEQLNTLKNEFQISMSTIYKDALKAYVEQKEMERWKKAAVFMVDEYENNLELSDWLEFEEEFCDDKAV